MKLIQRRSLIPAPAMLGESVRARNKGARAAPAGLDAWGGGREAGAPLVTRVLSVKPDGCV